MTLIDRYIISRFIGNFVILFVLLFVFAVSIDVLLQLDNFVEIAREIAGEDAGTPSVLLALGRLLLNFHGPRIFQFYAYMLGLLSVGAMGFTLSQMQRHRELVAILASGIRLHRIAIPLACAVLGLNILQLLNQEFILPRLAPMLIREHGDIGRSGIEAFDVPFTADAKRNLLQSPLFDPATKTLLSPTILERDEGGRTIRRISADSATWDPEAKVWRLERGRAIMPQVAETGDEATPLLVAQTVSVYETDLSPEVLTMQQHRQFAGMLSYTQISQMIKASRKEDRDVLIRFSLARITTLLINMCVLVMTMTVFLLRQPGNAVRQSMKCAALAIPAMIGSLIALTVDFPGIPATVEAFLPAIILIPIAMFFWTTIRS